MRPGDRPVVLAAIAGAHGIRGEVRVKLFTDDLVAYRQVDVGGRPLTIAAVRNDVVRFAEVTDRSAAEALHGQAVAVDRSRLPPLDDGEYYHADLLGLPVTDTAGMALGAVVAVDNFGAGDVLEIERPDASRFMVPMNADAVPEWNAERLVVDPAFAA